MIEKLSILLYNIITNFYFLTILFSSLWNEKASKWVKGRKNIFQKIENQVNPNDDIIWIHCSSLGEFEQGRLIIETIKTKFPKYKILLTFFSPSGYELRKEYEFADYVFYLPLDGRNNSKKFIELVNPKVAILLKYDFWYHYLNHLNKNNIPLFLISAIFVRSQIFFKKYGTLYNKMLSFFTHIFVQDKASEELLNNIGFKNVTVVPDSRIDRVYQIYQDIQQDKLDILEKFKNSEIILIVGSSYQTEEKFINKYLESGKFNGKVILVPHNIDKNHIKKITETFGNQAVFYSEFEDKNSEIRSNILVIDKIGLLAIAYQYADIAFIGGGFNNGIHNILEPAVFGLPIILGPKDIDKFKEARDLTQMGGAFIVKSYIDFEKNLDFLLDKNNRVISGKICKDYIFENKGGSEKVIESLETFL